MVVPFIKCECNYFREVVVRGLGRINIEAVRDLVEELHPHIKECADKRQEKQRRMKKRDVIRLCVVRILELMTEHRTLGKRLVDTFKKSGSSQLHQQIQQQQQSDEQQLRKMFTDYVEGMLLYLDQEADKVNSDLVVQIRLHFSKFLYKIVDSVFLEKRTPLFTFTTRNSLFYLCDKWSGRFSLTQHGINVRRIFLN